MASFCDQCGERLGDRARFCPSCGAARAVAEPAPDPAPSSPPRPAAGSELAGRLGELGRTPAVVAAGVIGGGTFAVVFVAGLVLAALPDASLVGFLGAGAGYLEEACRQMVQLVLAGFKNDSLFEVFRSTSRAAPGLFALVPTLTALSLTHRQAPRLPDAGLGLRFGVAAGGALLFALLMVIPALLTGDVDADVGQAFSFALLWGLIGGAAGTLLTAPPTPADRERVPARGRRLAATALTALKPLGLALLVTTAIGTALWIVDVATDGTPRGSRSVPIAVIDSTLFAVDHGVHTFELGTLAGFERKPLRPEALALPLPADQPQEIVGTTSEPFRLFAYSDGVGTVVFLLMLVVLIGIPLAAALLAGFLVVREREPGPPSRAAAWGAIVGPVWAFALAILNGLLQDTLFGHARGGSVFGLVLVFGALIGALGGFLAAREATPPPADA